MITDVKNLQSVPFLLRVAGSYTVIDSLPGKDLPTTQDNLPAVLESDSAGHVLARETYCTDVKRETTDDN